MSDQFAAIEAFGKQLAQQTATETATETAAETAADRDADNRIGGPAPENRPAPNRARSTGNGVDELANAIQDHNEAEHRKITDARTAADRENVSRQFLAEAGIKPANEEQEIVADALLVASLRARGFTNAEIDAADGRALRRMFKAQSADAHRRAPLDQAAERFKKSGAVEDLGALFTETERRRR